MNTISARPLERAFAQQSVLIALIVFALTVFAMGGGSRHDVSSILLLRPLAAAVLVYAIFAMRAGGAATIRPVILLAAATLALVAVQLIPLPPGLWKALPGHDPYYQMLAATGTDQVWRPATMSPSKTANALFSLIVPLAGIALFAALDKAQLVWIPRVILLAAIASALLSLLQIASGPGSVLYLYRITNEASGVGLFANRNHNAAFLAAAIPVAACLAALGQWLPERATRRSGNAIVSYALFLPVLALLVVAIVASGSRAGLLVSAPMIAAASAIFALHAASQRRRNERLGRKPAPSARLQNLFWIAPPIAGALAGAIAVLSDRGDAVSRLLSGQANDLRFNVLPDLMAMLGDFFPLGAGFGSFTHIYPQYERGEMLGPQYLNQAHNDWLQVLIEGGVPGTLLLLLAIGLILTAARIIVLRKSLEIEARLIGFACLSLIVCFALASLVDYPARAPSILLVLALAFCCAVHVSSVPSHSSTPNARFL